MKYKIFLLLCLLTLLLLSFENVFASAVPLQAPRVPQVKSSPTFERIALCESNNDPHNKNKHSSASGRFQFLWSTWHRYGTEFWGDDFYKKNIWDWTDNTDLAWYVYTTYGTNDWNASKNCWNTI